MRKRLISWWRSIWGRKYWFLFLLLYKIIEDWGLGKLIGYVEEHRGWLVIFLTYIIDYLPWITWIAIPITIMVLLVLTWRKSAKIQVATVAASTSTSLAEATSTQEAVIREYSPQVKETLDALIKHGEELTHQMQRDDFHRGQLGQEVRQWLDNTERDVWEVVPEHASHLTGNEAVTKEPYTDQERLRYAGWSRNAAALRVSVDRRLVRLREIRSRIPGISTEPGQDLSHEQVAENLTFIQQLRAVVERLLKNSQGAETRSIKSIAHDICSERPVREYIASDGLAGQTDRLLTHQLDDFFIRVSNYQRQVEGLSVANLDDTNINSICNTTRELVFDYRRLVDEVMVMLTNLENRGVEALWHKTPWSVRIHRELADNYDELMRLVVDLKTATPSYARDLLPKDDQTSKFKRASLWS